jgi:hypothetical protein
MRGAYVVCPNCWLASSDNFSDNRCYDCGWEVGTFPPTHPRVGDLVVIPRRILHPRALVEVLGATSMVTGFCGDPDGDCPQWLLPRGLLVREQVLDWLEKEEYAYALVCVVRLPEQWQPIPYDELCGRPAIGRPGACSTMRV